MDITFDLLSFMNFLESTVTFFVMCLIVNLSSYDEMQKISTGKMQVMCYIGGKPQLMHYVMRIIYEGVMIFLLFMVIGYALSWFIPEWIIPYIRLILILTTQVQNIIDLC